MIRLNRVQCETMSSPGFPADLKDLYLQANRERLRWERELDSRLASLGQVPPESPARAFFKPHPNAEVQRLQEFLARSKLNRRRALDRMFNRVVSSTQPAGFRNPSLSSLLRDLQDWRNAVGSFHELLDEPVELHRAIEIYVSSGTWPGDECLLASNNSSTEQDSGLFSVFDYLSFTPKYRGLNGLKLFWLHDDAKNMYGTWMEQIDDCTDYLGCQVVRQFGHRDLLWGELTGDQDTPIPASEREILDLVSTYQSDTTEMLNYALQKGLKLVFTFFTLGGGSSNRENHPDENYLQVLPFNWEEGTGISSDLLDIRLDGVREYMALVAKCVAEMLSAVEEGLYNPDGTRAYLADVVAGIEIFNEVDIP